MRLPRSRALQVGAKQELANGGTQNLDALAAVVGAIDQMPPLKTQFSLFLFLLSLLSQPTPSKAPWAASSKRAVCSPST